MPATTAHSRNGCRPQAAATLPPHDLEAERCVLGCMALGRDDDRLRQYHFYAEPHQKIFAVLSDMRGEGVPIDGVTLGYELDRRGLFADVGGATYIDQILSTVPHAEHVAHYAGIVVEKWRQREIIAKATEISQAARNGADVSRILADLSALDSSGTGPRIESIGDREFAARHYTAEDYLVNGMLVRGEPCVIGGPMKCLKTSIAVDLAYSMAAAAPFLGEFYAREARVGLISGESGERTLWETAARIRRAKDRVPSDRLHWSFKLPCLIEKGWQRALVRWSKDNGLDFVVIDPTYLALLNADAAKSASNLMVMGAALKELADVMREAQATPALCHHCGKGAARTASLDWSPLELSDLSMSGFGEFARQWLLLSRREKYQPGTGDHKLWLNVGGSAGHSGLYALDVSEGAIEDEGGRRWEVKVMQADEAQAEANQRRRENQQDRDAENASEAVRRITDYLKQHPGGQTKSRIRDALGGSRPIMAALANMLDSGDLVECSIDRNRRKENALRLT